MVKKLSFILVLFIITPLMGIGQDAQSFFLQERPEKWLPLNSHLQIIEEKRPLYIYEISSNAYINRFLPYDIFGTLDPDASYWGRLSIWNNSQEEQNLVLAVSNRYPLNEVTIYYRVNRGEFRHIEIGNASKDYATNAFFGKRGNHLSFHLTGESYIEFFIRIHNITGYDPKFNLEVIDESVFRRSQLVNSFLQGIFHGAIWMILIFQLLIFFMSREKARVFYSLYALIITIYFLDFHNYSRFLPVLEDFMYNSSIMLFAVGTFSVWYISFIRFFLRLWQHIEEWDLNLKRYVVLKLALTAVSIVLYALGFISFRFAIDGLLFLVLLESILIFILLVRIAFLDLKIKYFVIGGTLILYATIVVAYILFYVTDRQNAGEDFLQFGVFIEILIFSLGLGYRIRATQNVHKLKQEKRIKELEGKNALIVESEKGMKSAFGMREREFEEKKSLVQRLLNEIQEKEMSIGELDDLITSQKEIIEQQNEQLALNREYLENIVDVRTTELREINHQLVNQANQLEQFAYVTSHNLRAPVATLIGLVSLLDKKHIYGEENRYIVGEMEKHTSILDDIIRDLNKILQLKRGHGYKIETVFLSEAINEVLDILKDQIEEGDAKISFDFSEINTIRSIRAYMVGIFYNLISNAIKYRHPDRRPVVKVKSYWKNNEVVIEVSDNGIGIDLMKFKDRMFGLYQRFHLNIEGKGLGLYMTRAQTEALGGSIDVDSELDKGTRFTLHLRHALLRNPSLAVQAEDIVHQG